MSQTTMDDHFGFAMESDGDAVTFTTRGAGAGTGFWVGMFFVSLLVGLMAALMVQSMGGFPVGIVLALIVAFFADQARRKTSVFRVSSSGIETGGGRYEIDKVTEILWGNKAGTVQSTPVGGGMMVVGGTGVAGAMIATNAAIGAASAAVADAMKGSLQKRGYHVSIRYGRHVVPLANHLTEDVAVALFNEVHSNLAGQGWG